MAGSMLMVMFTYAGFEIIGLAASEAKNPQKTIPKAISYTVISLVSLYVTAIAFILPLAFSAAAAALFTLVCLLFPEWILGLFSKDQEVILLGGQFLKVVSLSYIMTAITFCFYFALRSTGQAKLPMQISVLALILNTVLNYIFIFGKFGAPAMGVRGSALGTVIARTVELALLMTVIYRTENVVAGKLKEMFDFTRDFINKFLHTTIPVILNECLWSVGITMYSVVYARMGTGVIASINIASTVERIAMVLFMGMGLCSCGA